jgi:hypothetical protein
MIIATVFCGLAFGQTDKTENQSISINVIPYEYIQFKETAIYSTNDEITVNGTLYLISKGIFGHVDVVAYDSAANIIKKAKTEDVKYRWSDQNKRMRPFFVDLGVLPNCKSVDITFHETRLHPDEGLCIEK